MRRDAALKLIPGQVHFVSRVCLVSPVIWDVLRAIQRAVANWRYG